MAYDCNIIPEQYSSGNWYCFRSEEVGVNCIQGEIDVSLYQYPVVREKKGKSLYKRDKKGDYASFCV